MSCAEAELQDRIIKTIWMDCRQRKQGRRLGDGDYNQKLGYVEFDG